MTGYEFTTGPFHNVHWLIDNTEKFYDLKVLPKGGPNKYAAAIKKILECRQWTPTHRLYADHFEAVLRELNIFYVPKQLNPGPAIVFPLRDVRGNYMLGRLKPLYELIIADEVVRYAFLGNTRDTIGPNWLGMSRETTKRIIEQRFVNIVEGPFDYLACRLLAPEIPTLSTGTKNFNDKHVAHLRLLGVKRIYIMFDKDESKEGLEQGHGDLASGALERKYDQQELNIEIKRTHWRGGSSDPSDCLMRVDWAKALKESLDNMRGI
jgi:hypothetical protein